MTTVIKIDNLWKEYRLGVIGHGTLTKDLQSWWAKVRGKEDPNSRIPLLKGQEKQIEGDRFWALRGVDLEVKQGEILGIIGRNGAGKSTLLKILSRVTAPTRGQIRVKGRIASLLEVGTGFHPELTGRENIFMNGSILGMSKREIKAKFDEIVDFSGISEFIDTPVKRYSSGMYVRLAFAVAAHLEPEIMIVDEVLAVGDAAFQRKCIGKMNDAAGHGRTILFVSHNMRAVEQLCSKAILLTEGNITENGKVSDISKNYIDSQTEYIDPRLVRFNGPIAGRGIAIKEVLVNNQKMEKIFLEIQPHEEIKVNISVSFKSVVENVNFSLAVIKENIRIFTINYPENGTLKCKIDKIYNIEYIIPRYLLRPDTYNIGFGGLSKINSEWFWTNNFAVIKIQRIWDDINIEENLGLINI